MVPSISRRASVNVGLRLISFDTPCRNVPAMNRRRFSVVPNFAVLKSRFLSQVLPLASSLVSSPNLICTSCRISSLEVSISTVELFIGFSKLLHRGDAPILIIELSGCADDFLALSACCQFLDNFAQKMFVIAFGRFKLAPQVD